MAKLGYRIETEPDDNGAVLIGLARGRDPCRTGRGGQNQSRLGNIAS
jgi:hypothetical protein